VDPVADDSVIDGHWTPSMTKAALLVVAATRSLDVTSANTKAEIVAALEASDPK